MEIKAINYIENGFSAEDAEKIKPLVVESLEKQDNVVIDFDGVKFFTTLFFSQAFTYLVGVLGKEVYFEKVLVQNLTESGNDTYQHAVDYAVEYYTKNSDEQKIQDDIIEHAKKEVTED